MFGILTSLLSPRPSKASNRCRLQVESLEERWCPATNITLSAAVAAGHMVTLSGAVTGGEIAGVSVMFSGSVSGGAITDSSGNYSYTTSSASLGNVSAVGTDSFLNTTNSAQATIAVMAPTLTLSIASVSNNLVTLTGHLTSLDNVGRSVTFSGVTSGSATTDSNGNFSLTTSAMGLGTIYATETDLWGQVSNTPTATLSSNVPVIENFAASRGIGDIWTFTGRVVDEDPANLFIMFSGPDAMDGQSVTVNADGTFSFTRTIPGSQLPDLVSAVTSDWFNQSSDSMAVSLT